MNEQEFWVFLKRLWEKGRAKQAVMTVDQMDLRMQPVAEYMQGHALLPRDYDKIGLGDIAKIGGLLFKTGIRPKTKQAAMMILAHHPSEMALILLSKYSLAPDKGLELFAQMALDECAMWNE